ncbi:hypothetical protein I552_3165 [Mycobacterium xenopi 3993]|nr:hypothetical protein I552_3165 [Mycobacterium xenopi 3993]
MQLFNRAKLNPTPIPAWKGTAMTRPSLSLNPWMGDFVLPSTRLFWDAAECGAVGRG